MRFQSKVIIEDSELRVNCLPLWLTITGQPRTEKAGVNPRLGGTSSQRKAAAAAKLKAVSTAFRCYTAVVMRTGVFVGVETPVLIQS